MIFRQLFEPVSSTYTYLLGCEQTGRALLVDPVLPTWERDLVALNALSLELACTVETHVHADHITAALRSCASAARLEHRAGAQPQSAPRRRAQPGRFLAIMRELKLPYPKFIDHAVPGNRR